MKTLKTIITLSIAATFLSSCGNTKNSASNEPIPSVTRSAQTGDYSSDRTDAGNTTSTNRSSANTSSDRNNQDRNAMDNGRTNSATNATLNNGRMNDTNRNTTQDNNSSTAAKRAADNDYWSRMKNRDMTSMYTSLKMTQDQRTQYEKGYHNYIINRQRNHPESIIDRNEMMKNRDEWMKGILISDQYNAYEQWKKDNPNDGIE